MPASQPANFNLQEFSDTGQLLAGGRLYTYWYGTTTQKTAYTDPAGAVPHTYTADGAGGQYIALNARGELPAPLYLGAGSYDLALKRGDGSTVWTRKADGAEASAAAWIVSLAASLGASLIGFLQGGIGAVLSTVQNELRRSYYVGQFDSPAHAVVAAAGKRLFVEAGETVVLNVPGQFNSLPAAWAALRGWVIHGTAQIKLADGVYAQAASLLLNHPFGANIQIVGNVAAPDNVVVVGPSPPTFDLFVVSAGQQFGLIKGLRASLPAKAAQANNCTAFLALNGASLTLDHCNSDNWYYGVAARNGGVIHYTSGTVDHAGDVGVWAFAGGNIQCTNVASNNAIDVEKDLGFGFQAEFGGVVEAQNCSATGNRKAGLAALSNGTGRYYNCVANANLGSGIMSRGGGQIEANGSTSTGNARYGIEITEYGNIVNLAANSGNTLGDANAFPYFDVSTGQARLAASVGQLRLDTNGVESVFVNTVGGLQAEIRHMPDAVNHVVLQGGGAGKAAAVRVDGSDAVADLALFPHGAGSYVQLGAGYTAGAPGVTGYFSVRLDDGSLVQVPCKK